MKYFIVNAFTDSPDAGNPAAVCLVEDKLPDKLMQDIASEFGLPETAFVEKKNGGFVYVELTKKRVLLGGKAATFSSGKFMD